MFKGRYVVQIGRLGFQVWDSKNYKLVSVHVYHYDAHRIAQELNHS